MYTMSDQLRGVIDRLTEAAQVAREAADNEKLGYAYATGYSLSAMRASVDNLETILNFLEELEKE